MITHSIFFSFHYNSGLPSRLIWQEGGPRSAWGPSPGPEQLAKDIDAGRTSPLVIPKYVPPEKLEDPEEPEKVKEPETPIVVGFYSPDAERLEDQFPGLSELFKKMDAVEARVKMTPDEIDPGADEAVADFDLKEDVLTSLKRAVLLRAIAENWSQASLLEVYEEKLDSLSWFLKYPTTTTWIKRIKKGPINPERSGYRRVLPGINVMTNRANQKIKPNEIPAIEREMLTLEANIRREVLGGKKFWVMTKEYDADLKAVLDNYVIPINRQIFLNQAIVFNNKDRSDLLSDYGEWLNETYEEIVEINKIGTMGDAVKKVIGWIM